MKALPLTLIIFLNQIGFAKTSAIPQKAEETVKAASELVGTTQSELRASFQDNLKKLDTELNELKSKIKKSGNLADAELQKQLNEVEAKRANLKRRFGELEFSSQNAISDVERGLKKAWSDLSESFRSAKGRFEKAK